MKLTYFGFHARAGPTRMLLDHSKQEWENEVLTPEQFGERKAAGDFPAGSLPILSHKGRIFN